MKKTMFLAVMAILGFVLTFTACDDFFSNTAGNFRDYEAENINVTPANVDLWVQRVIGNPPLAELVSKEIVNKLRNGGLNEADRMKLQRAGMKIASESSGLGMSLLSNALGTVAELVNLFNENEDLDEGMIADLMKKMFNNVQDDFRNSGGVEAANTIADMLNDDIMNKSGVPTFTPSYANTLGPAEVTKAVMVLVMGELADVDIDDIDLDDITHITESLTLNSDQRIEVINDPDIEPPSASALALAAYLNLIADDPVKYSDNPFTKSLGQSFNVVK